MHLIAPNLAEAPMSTPGSCNPACTSIIKCKPDYDITARIGISLPPYTSVDGDRHINIIV